jgi:hypothetical protein
LLCMHACVRVDPTKPLSVPAVSMGIGRVLRNLEFEDLTAHGFRKFWEQNMKADREAYLKQIIGRKLSETEHAYLEKKNPTELLEIYKKSYDNLRVLTQPDRMKLAEEYQTELDRVKEAHAKEISEITKTVNTLQEQQRKILDNLEFDREKWEPIIYEGYENVLTPRTQDPNEFAKQLQKAIAMMKAKGAKEVTFKIILNAKEKKRV